MGNAKKFQKVSVEVLGNKKGAVQTPLNDVQSCNTGNALQYKSNVLAQTESISGQVSRTYWGFFTAPKTMLMLSEELNIRRANICRYVSKFRKADRIYIAKRGLCLVSGFPANFYTTNENLQER